MKVTVGLVGHGHMTKVRDEEDATKLVDKFIADTATIYIEDGSKDTDNMHEGNYVAVSLAIARKKLQTEVFPVEITKPVNLPKRPVKGGK